MRLHRCYHDNERNIQPLILLLMLFIGQQNNLPDFNVDSAVNIDRVVFLFVLQGVFMRVHNHYSS